MIILEHVPFSDEQFYRLLQNCSIDLKLISTPAAFDGGRYDICALYIERTCRDVSQLMDFAGQLHDKFHNQFKHNSKVRRICTNPNCKSKYAYFYEDFLYCPKCGTKLITTRNDTEELHDGL